MSEKSDAVQDLFEEIRKINNRLRWLGDNLHPELGVTAPKRSLLIKLLREGPQTVPDLARERLVSRQIVQTQINDLLKEGWVASRENPRHRRSSLIDLTNTGKDLTLRMLYKETQIIEGSRSAPEIAEVKKLISGLASIREHIERESYAEINSGNTSGKI